MRRGCRVVKVGGSLLGSPRDYHGIAARLVRSLEKGPTWVVISAAAGITDALQSVTDADVDALITSQGQTTGIAVSAALRQDLEQGLKAGDRNRVVSWGERASAEALSAWLRQLGIDLGVRELGHLPHWSRSVIVPGFYLRTGTGTIRLLPRGGSDITALLVGRFVGAGTVDLWKNGGGIHAGPGILSFIDYGTLSRHVGESISPIHPRAIELASRSGIEIVMSDPYGRDAATTIGPVDRAQGRRLAAQSPAPMSSL